MWKEGEWDSRRSGPRGSPWSMFHLINNFLITHKPILKLDVLFFLFLPDIYFRYFKCWNMPLIWKMWP